MGKSGLSGPLLVGGVPVGLPSIPAAFDNKVFYVLKR